MTSDIISVSPFFFYSNVLSFTNPIPLVAVYIPGLSGWAPRETLCQLALPVGAGLPRPAAPVPAHLPHQPGGKALTPCTELLPQTPPARGGARWLPGSHPVGSELPLPEAPPLPAPRLPLPLAHSSHVGHIGGLSGSPGVRLLKVRGRNLAVLPFPVPMY